MKLFDPVYFAFWRWKWQFVSLPLFLIPVVAYGLTTPTIWYLTYYDAPKLHSVLEATYYVPANWFFENIKIYHDFWIWEAHLVYGS